jgi:hypothetical protein
MTQEVNVNAEGDVSCARRLEDVELKLMVEE